MLVNYSKIIAPSKPESNETHTAIFICIFCGHSVCFFPSWNKGAVRIWNAENITLHGLMVEGLGATVSDHLVYLDCRACTVSNAKFNNIHTAPGFDFFYLTVDRSVQFVAVTFKNTTTGREYIHGSGADEIAVRVFP